jgi:ABC-type phosphate/phosphonate transport system substrate-binding protein
MQTNNRKRNYVKTHHDKQSVISHLFLSIVFLGWFIMGGIGCERSPQYEGKAKLLLSPAPYSLPMVEARFIFLFDYLTKETGWEFEKVIAPQNEAGFIKMVETERFDLSIVNPFLSLFLAEKQGAIPILKMVSFDGKDSYRGLIVCRTDSPIQSLSDLRGKQILASSRAEVGGFIAQWILLKQHGLEPERDLIFQFGITQEEIIEKILLRRGEVGFIREDVYNAMKKSKGVTPQLKVLAYTSYFPNPCVVIFPDTPLELAEKVKTALLNLKMDNPAHRFILERIRMTGFSPASAEDYKDFRSLLISYGLFPSNVSPSSQRVPSQ